MIKSCNGVFEGGGVRGIGHVGAALTMEEAGWRFAQLAGSSAGAIVASLLAAGYSARELVSVMQGLDYTQFRQAGLLSALGAPGKAASLVCKLGVYRSDYLEQWLSGLLAAKGVRCFGDLRTTGPSKPGCSWRLLVTASDVTDQRLLILPRDLASLGLEPDRFSVAQAVRMSMSIPVFYQPYRLRGAWGRTHLVVDGGLLSNYPLWLFDDDNCPSPYPTVGFRFVDSGDYHRELCGSHPGLWQYLGMLQKTALDAADKQHIAENGGAWAHTVAIPVTVTVDGEEEKISATDFDITKTQSRLLLQNGAEAARRFLVRWDGR